MLKIFTSIELAEEYGYIVERDIDAIFSIRSEDIANMYIDETSIRILKEIEGMTARNKDRIIGKFGDVSLYDISTGGKGCLLAVNCKDFIIDACQLGDNCLSLLIGIADTMDIVIVHSDPIYSFGNKTVMINNIEYKGFKASKAMMDAEYLEEIYD
jgi:hypothetical protein